MWITELGLEQRRPRAPVHRRRGHVRRANLQQSYDTLLALPRPLEPRPRVLVQPERRHPAAWARPTTGATTRACGASTAPPSRLGTPSASTRARSRCPVARGDALRPARRHEPRRRAPSTRVVSSAPRVIGAARPARRVTFTASRGDATFECSLDGAAWTPCQSPVNVRTTREGAHELVVRAIDGGGVADTDAGASDLDPRPHPAGHEAHEEAAAQGAEERARSGCASRARTRRASPLRIPAAQLG